MGFSAESIYSELEKILASRTFRYAAAQREFLRYAVTEELQGQGHLLKEYAVGVAVFLKGESFDARVDSIVRGEARKLRARLARYFEGEGKADPLRIQFPVGKYVPVFTEPSRHELVSPRTENGQNLRLAVLPFVSRSANRRDEFFSDGLTDELTHAFARIHGLEVVPRTSAFQFKGQNIDVREIGRRLNVHAVIEGSIRTSGNRIRIIAQLADALNGQTLWSGSYDRKLTDLFAVQLELSATVTDELGVHFRSRASLHTAHNYGLALYFLHRYDEAISQFRKALALNASHAAAHAGLGMTCVHKGSYARGIAELELAQKLTPGLGRVTADVAYAYAVSGNRDKAIEILNRFLDRFDPACFPAVMIAEIYIGLRDKDRAFEWLHKAIGQKDLTVFLKSDPLYDALRKDPRFSALLRRTNLS